MIYRQLCLSIPSEYRSSVVSIVFFRKSASSCAYADASLFSLRGAIEKSLFPSMMNDAQILGAGGLL
jgi:hypothetical protein